MAQRSHDISGVIQGRVISTYDVREDTIEVLGKGVQVVDRPCEAVSKTIAIERALRVESRSVPRVLIGWDF
jgi:hypothetical protein